jgi:dihydroflavonol-4-reductase
MKKILLTGADGLLGSNICRILIDRGYDVTAFIHPSSTSTTLDVLSISLKKGDLLDPQSVESAMQGCDYIIHTAANTNIWPFRSEIIRKVNVDGTRNVIAAAKKLGVKKMVHIGTANTFGFGTLENPGDETRPYNGSKYGLDYMDSKYQIHHEIIKEVSENQFPCVVVNPTFMLGKYDTKPSSGAMVKGLAEGKVPGYTMGGRNYIYVKDAAIGVVNALEKGKVGESYILGNKNMSYKEAFGLIAKVIDGKRPKFGLPYFISYVYAVIGSAIAKLQGKAPTITVPMIKIAYDTHYFTAQKAVNEIDLPQTPIEIAIQESYEWLSSNNMINK